jgi:galactonate dehydratase
MKQRGATESLANQPEGGAHRAGDPTFGSHRATRIVKIESFAIPPRWLFIRVETGDGAVGWGEASLEGHSEAVEGACTALRERFIGTDSLRIEDIWQTGYRLGFYRGGPVLMSALSGLDQALWDLKGRRLGVPVWELLGGRVRDRIECYSWIGGDRPDEVRSAARARREQGFRSVKMNATAQMAWLASPKELDGVLERVRAVQAEGLDVGLDFHGRLHKPMAKQLVALLEPLRLKFIEEPLLCEHIEALEQLARTTTTPIALGERLFSRWDFKPFLERGIVDIAQPDLSHAGGISEVRRIGALAEAYDVPLAPHCPLGPLAFAACLQIGAATPNFAIAEMGLGIHYNTPEFDLLSYLKDPEVFAIRDGYVQVPTGPGLGITVAEDRVREAARDYHSWRSPVWRAHDGSIAEW